MSRKPQVRWFESRKAYYCQLNGKQYCLHKCDADDGPSGPNFQEATRAHWRLMTTGSVQEKSQQADGLEMLDVVNFYIAHLEATSTAEALRRFLFLMVPLNEKCGEIKMSEMKPYHIQQFLTEMASKWNSNTQALALQQINRTINFAVKQGRLSGNPIRGVEKPSMTTRGEECYLTKEFRNLVVEHAYGDFKFVVSIINSTGARPVEIEMAEAHNFNRDLKALVYNWNTKKGYVWKNAKKTKKNRTVFLSDEQAEMVAKKVVERPTGKLFRTKTGADFDAAQRHGRWAKILKKKPVSDHMIEKCMIRKHVIPYSFRHSYITDWLLTGRSIKVCADLCGTSVAMIERTYGHLQIDSMAMRRMWLSFHEVK